MPDYYTNLMCIPRLTTPFIHTACDVARGGTGAAYLIPMVCICRFVFVSVRYAALPLPEPRRR